MTSVSSHPQQRESLRHALQSSLNEILGDVSRDAQDMMSGNTMVHRAQGGGSPFPPQSMQQRSPIPSVFGNPSHSLLAQSLGMSTPSPSYLTGGPLGFHQLDDMALKAATVAAEARILAHGRAMLMQKQLAHESLFSNFGSPMVAKAPVLSQVERPKFTEQKKMSQTLQALGTNLRSRNDPYIDVSSYVDPISEATPSSARTRGGVSEPFPEKLARMLREVEKEGKTDIVSFFPHGRAFGVHDMDRFISEIMPKYFKQTKWNSFARQLNLYGFLRISSGPDAGGYYHELFLRNKPTLCLHMRRVGVPQGEDRRKFRPKNNVSDPDFYSMPPVV